MEEWYGIIYRRLKEEGQLIQMSEQFSSLQSDLERVSFTWQLDCVQSAVVIKEKFQGKCKTKSVSSRNDGNKKFQLKKFSDALILYNKSVNFAPLCGDEPEFSMAVANRSAVLIHMKQYSQCLLDIDLALAYGYPNTLKYKLFERQGKCHFFMHEPLKAFENFNKAHELLSMSNLSKEKYNGHCKTLEMWMTRSKEVLKQQDERSDNIEQRIDCTIGVAVTGDENETFPCLSSKVEVTSDDEKGRQVKAVEEIKVGDVVAIEKPYASVLLCENYLTHCQHCLKRLLSSFPCRQCARVSFCSRTCERAAWLYHKYECKYLDFLSNCGVEKFGFLALRVMTKTMWPVLKKFKNDKRPEEQLSGDGSFTKPAYGNSYFEVYNLLAHTEDRSTSDLFRRSVLAVLLVKCLASSGYFGSPTTKQKDDFDVLFAASHILRMLQVLPCNAHEISEFIQKEKDLVNSHTIEIAAAIYPTFSLFNHSCDPCVTRNFYGDTCVMRAIQTVRKGDEVFDNYGYVSAVTPLAERQAELKKQYYFTCSCPACIEAWPLYADLECLVPILKCRRCHRRVVSREGIRYKCPFCKEEMDVAARLKEIDDAGACLKVGIDKMIVGDDKAALPQLIACVERLDECLSRPWQNINSCQQGIIQCFNVLQTNRYVERNK